MAIIERLFDTLDTSTFLDGGSQASVTDTGQNSEVISLATFEGVHCYVEADFPASPTDDLVIEVLSSPDGDNFDTVPLFSFTLDNASDGNVSWIVTSVFSFRVKFKSSGTNDSISVNFRYRRWQWQSV